MYVSVLYITRCAVCLSVLLATPSASVSVQLPLCILFIVQACSKLVLCVWLSEIISGQEPPQSLAGLFVYIFEQSVFLRPVKCPLKIV